MNNLKILIIAATDLEIESFLKSEISGTATNISVLITGVGMVATAYSLAKELAKNQYDLLVNVGIAGAFRKDIRLGTVVRINEDIFCELGAEDGEHFSTLHDLGFGEVHYHEKLGKLNNLPFLKGLPIVKGITVNKVHGNEISIQKIIELFSPDTESMEGASVFYVAKHENIPAIQIRSISNLVEKRNKNNWNIPLAIKNLNDWLMEFITAINNIHDET